MVLFCVQKFEKCPKSRELPRAGNGGISSFSVGVKQEAVDRFGADARHILDRDVGNVDLRKFGGIKINAALNGVQIAKEDP